MLKTKGHILLMPIRRCIAFIVLLIWNGGLAAQNPKNYTTQWSIINDNDLYLLTYQDQYYTNGVGFSLRQLVSPSHVGAKKIRQWSLGHQMFNAYTAQIDSIQAIDRPITAYLSGALQMDYYMSPSAAWNWRVEVGMIGPAALGKPLQEGLHNLLAMYAARGWDYQLNNAFGAHVGGQWSQILRKGNWWDWSYQGNARLGISFTDASLQSTFRIGNIQNMEHSAHWGGQLGLKSSASNTEWYLYISPGLRANAFDFTLQGGFWNKEKGRVVGTPQPLVWSNQVGGVYVWKAWSFGAHFIFRTKESKEAFFRHQFGSMRLSFRY
jgi:lipid A 3-O-deacylase